MKAKGLICNLLLLIIFILLSFYCYGKGGGFIYDTFREAVIPEQIIQGKVLYKDILCLYPPLGYYFNTLLFKLFGSSLNILYITGVVNSAIILLCISKIMKEISDKRTVLITILSIMLMFVFRIREPDCGNWFLPYSFSLIYAFSTCFISLTAYILFIKYKKIKFLYTACFFIGLSIAFKFDFTAFALIIIYCLIKQKSLCSFFKGFGLILMPFVISILIFSFSNFNSLYILKDEIILLHNFAINSNVSIYNKTYMPQLISPEIIRFIKISFLSFVIYFSVGFLISTRIYSLYLKTENKVLFKIIFTFLTGIILFFTFPLLIGDKLFYIIFNQFEFYLHNNLVFLSYFILISGILLFIYKKIKKQQFEFKQKIFFILLLAAYTIAYRNAAGIFLSNGGNFSIVLFWILFIYLFLEVLPNLCQKLNTEIFKNCFCFAIILYALSFTIQYIHFNKNV